MSEPADQGASQTYIWIIACILFISVTAGGGCLLAYMTIPEYQSSNFLPVLGFILVCMTWIFWIVTVAYRLLSRAFGFRMVFGSLYGDYNNNTTKAVGTGDDGDASKGVNDIDDAKIDVNVKSVDNDGESIDISSKSRESEKALASSMAT